MVQFQKKLNHFIVSTGIKLTFFAILLYMKHTQQGFIGVVLVIIAALLIGGGVYYVRHSADTAKQASDISVNAETTLANETKKRETGTERPLDNGTTSTHMTLDQLLAVNDGRSLQCTSSTTNTQGVVINSTAYLTGGSIRGDSAIVSGGATTMSSLILKDGMLYSWTGNTGMKMSISASFNLLTLLSASGQAATQEYACVPWVVDVAKFVVPTSIRFTDYGAITVPQNR